MAPFIKNAASVEQAVARVFTVGELTRAEMRRVEQAVMDVGRGVQGPEAAAEALYSLASAGLTTSEQLEALPIVLQQAVAANISLGDSAQLLVQGMRAFGIEAQNAARIANVVAASNAVSSSNAERLAIAYRMVAASANSFGISLEETTGALNILIDVYQNGEMAGTALRNVFSRLSTGTTQLRDAAREAGIPLRELNPTMVGTGEAVRNMSRLFEAGGSAFEIFGQEGQTAATILAQNAHRYDEMVDAITDTTAATDQYNIMVGTVENRFAALRNSINTTAISFTDKLRPVILWAIDLFQKFVDAIDAIPGPIKTLLAYSALFSAAWNVAVGVVTLFNAVIIKSIAWFAGSSLASNLLTGRLWHMIKAWNASRKATQAAAASQAAAAAAQKATTAATETATAAKRAGAAADAAWRVRAGQAVNAHRNARKAAEAAAAAANTAAGSEIVLAKARTKGLLASVNSTRTDGTLAVTRTGLATVSGTTAGTEIVLSTQRGIGNLVTTATNMNEKALVVTRGALTASTTALTAAEVALARARFAGNAGFQAWIDSLYRAYRASRGLTDGAAAASTAQRQLQGTLLATGSAASTAAKGTTAFGRALSAVWGWVSKLLVGLVKFVGRFILLAAKIGLVIWALQSMGKSWVVFEGTMQMVGRLLDQISGKFRILERIGYALGIPFKVAGSIILGVLLGISNQMARATAVALKWAATLRAIGNWRPGKGKEVWEEYRAEIEGINEELEETLRLNGMLAGLRAKDIWYFNKDDPGLAAQRRETELMLLDMEKVGNEMQLLDQSFARLLDNFSFEFDSSPLQQSLRQVDAAFQTGMEALDELVQRFDWVRYVDAEGNKLEVGSEVESMFDFLARKLIEESDRLKEQLVLEFVISAERDAEREVLAAMQASTDKILAEYNFRQKELGDIYEDQLANVGDDLEAQSRIERAYQTRSMVNWQRYLDDLEAFQDDINRLWRQGERDIFQARIDAMEDGEAKIRAQFALRRRDLEQDYADRLESVEGNVAAETSLIRQRGELLELLTAEEVRAIQAHLLEVKEAYDQSTADFEEYLRDTEQQLASLRALVSGDAWQQLMADQAQEVADARQTMKEQTDEIYADAAAGVISIAEANERAGVVVERSLEYIDLLWSKHLQDQQAFIGEREAGLLEHASKIAEIYRQLEIEGIESPEAELRAQRDAELALLDEWYEIEIAKAVGNKEKLEQIEEEYQAERYAINVRAERALTALVEEEAEKRAEKAAEALIERAEREAAAILRVVESGIGGVVTMADLETAASYLNDVRDEMVALGATREQVAALGEALGIVNTAITNMRGTASDFITETATGLEGTIAELTEALYFSPSQQDAASLQRILDSYDTMLDAAKITLRTMISDEEAYAAAVIRLTELVNQAKILEEEKARRAREKAAAERVARVREVEVGVEEDIADLRIAVIEDERDRADALWEQGKVARRAQLDADLAAAGAYYEERMRIIERFNGREALLEQQREQERQRNMREFVEDLEVGAEDLRANLISDAIAREERQYEIARGRRQQEAFEQIDLYARTLEERETMLRAFLRREELLEQQHARAIAQARIASYMTEFREYEAIAERIRQAEASFVPQSADQVEAAGTQKAIDMANESLELQERGIAGLEKEVDLLEKRNQELRQTLSNLPSYRQYANLLRDIFGLEPEDRTAELKREVDLLYQALAAAEARNAPLAERLALAQQLKTAIEEIEEATGESFSIQDVRGLGAAADREYQQAIRDAAAAQQELDQNERRLTAAKEQLEAMKIAAEQMTTAITGLSDKLGELQAAIQASDEAMQGMVGSLERARREAAGEVFDEDLGRFLLPDEILDRAVSAYKDGLTQAFAGMGVEYSQQAADEFTKILGSGNLEGALLRYWFLAGEKMPEEFLRGLLNAPAPGTGEETLAESLGITDLDAYLENLTDAYGRSLVEGVAEGAANAEGGVTADDLVDDDTLNEDVGDMGTTAGKGLIQAFADGITSNRSILLAAVDSVLGEVRERLPSSDAKKGPLSDLTRSGKALVRTFVGGAEGQSGYLGQHMNRLFSGATPNMALPGGTRHYPGGPGFGAAPVIGNMNVDGRTVQPTGIMELSARQLVEAVRREVRTQNRMR